MAHIRRFSNLALTLLVFLALTTSVVLAAPPAQDPDNGKALWEQSSCQRCHGPSSEGLWAGPLAGNNKAAEDWISKVRSSQKRMPTYSPEQVSDQAIIDMHTYLTSLPKPESFTPADAGLPDDAPAGQKLLVEKQCVACHKTTGPIKGFTNRGETPTAEAVIAAMRTPKNMPAYSVEQVSDEGAALIAEFLASQVVASTLPETGSAGPSILWATLLLLGGGILLTGFALRRLTARP